jgi:hypothetical protein
MYSIVLHTVSVTKLSVAASRNFSLIKDSTEGAKNCNIAVRTLRNIQSNKVHRRRLNAASVTFSELPLIPKDQDAMTSVENLAIVSITSTGDPVNSE